jgi:hypothetical protein
MSTLDAELNDFGAQLAMLGGAPIGLPKDREEKPIIRFWPTAKRAAPRTTEWGRGEVEKIQGVGARRPGSRVGFAIFVRNCPFSNDFKLLDGRTVPAGIESEEARGALDPPVGTGSGTVHRANLNGRGESTATTSRDWLIGSRLLNPYPNTTARRCGRRWKRRSTTQLVQQMWAVRKTAEAGRVELQDFCAHPQVIMPPSTSSASKVTAALVVISSKTLSGRTKDKDIGYIAEHLTALLDLKEVRVVGDEAAQFAAASLHLSLHRRDRADARRHCRRLRGESIRCAGRPPSARARYPARISLSCTNSEDDRRRDILSVWILSWCRGRRPQLICRARP